jgi:hypothetical protein
VITTDGHEGGQTVNLIDPAAVKKAVQAAFYPTPATPQPTVTAKSLAPSVTTVDVLNGGAASGLAGQMSQALTSAGFKAGHVGDATPVSGTEVLYGTGGAGSAARIAGYFNGVTATASTTVAAGHVELVLGPDALSVPATVAAGSATSSPAASPSSPSPSATSSSDNGQAGAPVTVAPAAPYGIPCVY